ncbi:MAG: polyprenyl synthetase family protein [Myxococcota bacterium]|nr:polyprenyl synthetase family protein [Myxococcota bacterium]MDW8361766.1 polyprenyl synthetase family protein [Myxococcales bacterium]
MLPSWSSGLRERLQARLGAFFEEQREHVSRQAPAAGVLVDAIADLTLRGGKRLRPLLTAAAYRALDAGGDPSRTLEAGAALELLQTYLLVHDDWMDQDEQRRGGPSVLGRLRRMHPDDAHLAASLTVLAGDLAAAFSGQLLARAPFPPARLHEAYEVFWQMQLEVFYGQHLDLVGSDDLDRKYDLKTASYTVRGPVLLGALLADAPRDGLEILARWSRPVGIAFQLADDLLGAFGDPEQTGKPAGGDLRAGKRTALLVEAWRRDPDGARSVSTAVLGRADADAAAIRDATAWLERTGARRAIEARIESLLAQADGLLDEAPFDATELRQLARALAVRDH